jgi:hypothetical protein
MGNASVVVYTDRHYAHRFHLLNNVYDEGEYALIPPALGTGMTEATVEGNGIYYHPSANSYATKIGDSYFATTWPNNTKANTRALVNFVDDSGKNFRLASNSPFKGQATDGTDPGVDYVKLNAAIEGVVP